MMNSFTRIAAGALLLAGLSGAASAQSVVTGNGEDTVVTVDPNGPIWGGALVRQIGTGESAHVVAFDVQHTQPGHLAQLIGSGESSTLVYADLPTSAPETPRAIARNAVQTAQR